MSKIGIFVFCLNFHKSNMVKIVLNASIAEKEDNQ